MSFHPQLQPATLDDYTTIQNMARFYVYDLSRECGFISKDWALPCDGLYESFDFKSYFEESTRRAFLIKVNEELAGFILLNQVGTYPDTLWNMGEFFILAKFQGKGIGQCVAHQIWDQLTGKWEVSVIPENKSALKFWQRTITEYTDGQFQELMKTIDYDKDQPQRIIFTFDAHQSAKNMTLKQEYKSQKDSTHPINILSDLKRREPIFHHPDEFGRSRQDILHMTCDEFWEVGASGTRYSREDVIQTLLERYANPEYKDIWETSDFELTQIAPDNYLLTYILVQNNTRCTRRSTIWNNINGQWKILYHQGTVIEEDRDEK